MSTDGGEGGSERQYTDRELLTRLLRYAKPERWWLGLLLVLDLVAAPLYLLSPLPLKMAIDNVIGDDPLPGFIDAVLPDAWTTTDARLLITVAALQVIFVLLIQLQQLGQLVAQKRTGEKLTVGLRARLFRHIQRLSFSFLDSRGTADSIYRVQYDTPAIEWLTIHGLIPLTGAFVTLGSMLYVMARIDIWFAVVALAVVPVILTLMRGYKTRMRPHYQQAKELQSSALDVVQETLGAFRVVKVFGREAEHSKRFERQSDKSIRAQVFLAAAEGAYGLTVQMTTGIGTAAVLYIGTRSVLSGGLSLGDLTLVMAYLARLFSPVQVISKTMASLQNHLASAQRVFEVLDEAPDIADRPGAVHLDRAHGRIETVDVHFSYGDDPDVLRDVSLTVEPGARVGIFGPTGAGKTTLLSLLMRIYEPDDGRVLLDGRDIRDIKLTDLREQFGVVLQDSVLFATSIAENIAYGRPGASRADVEEASRAAGAHDFILAMPDGYDTVVGERGMRLSGGERQRIALARAFLKDAPILVLDEPTSSVDVQTEAAIMEAMLSLMEGRTTFMIAHRLSTLDVCDMLVHVDGGSATEVQRQTLDRLSLEGAAVAQGKGPATSSVALAPPTSGGGGGTAPGADQDPSSRRQLVTVLEAVLGDAGYTGRLTVLDRRPDPYAPTGDVELVTCRVGEQELSLRCSRHASGRAGGRAEPYPVHVLRRILLRSDLPQARVLGTHEDPAAGVTWVVTEHPADAWRLHEIATVDVMDAATRWLGNFHRLHEFTLARDMPDLRRYRLDDYVTVAIRAERREGPEWLPRLCEGFAAAADFMLEPPLTAIVGDTYPSNWWVADGRAFPADLRGAAVGPGELDLATLLDGWPSEIVERCTALYRRVRWPDGPAELFTIRLDMARLYVHLDRMSRSVDQGEWPDWRIDGLHETGRRLGLL